MRTSKAGTSRAAFTLIELLAIVAIIVLLGAAVTPAFLMAKRVARNAICQLNLRHLHVALAMYLSDNNGQFFPYQENLPNGTLWYWGFEDTTSAASEGHRPLDKTRARLAPYFAHAGKMEVCPNVPYDALYFKRKFELASYGYAINRQMLAGMSGSARFDQIARPAETVVWADAIQINTWQAPASAANPMLEEWYYLDNVVGATPKFHFRHQRLCYAAFADGSVRALEPYWLDTRCDGMVGQPEAPVPPSQVSYLLRLVK